MELSAALQNAYDNRLVNLSTIDTAGMRALFSYFDTNRDGNLSSVQALRIFQLLGLTVAEKHVYELEQMSYAEFVSIIDCHVNIPKDNNPMGKEWTTLNHFRSDYISPHQLDYFLASCGKRIPRHHLQRFLESYSISDEAHKHYGHLDKAGFLKFIADYAEDSASGQIDNDNLVEGRRNALNIIQKELGNLATTEAAKEVKEPTN